MGFNLKSELFIYLTRNQKKILTDKFTQKLKEGGYLFLGNTEFIFNQFQLKKWRLLSIKKSSQTIQILY